MDDKTLGYCVEHNSLNGQVFESSVYITEKRHTLYRVNKVERDSSSGVEMLCFFPVKSVAEKVSSKAESFNVFYGDHKGDVCVSR